jgi:hypothetical protein
MTDGAVPGSRRPPLTCPSSFPRKCGPRVLGTLKPRALTATEARIALQRAWEDVTLVLDWLRAEHPVAHAACKLSARVVYSGLIAIDRVVGELEAGER